MWWSTSEKHTFFTCRSRLLARNTASHLQFTALRVFYALHGGVPTAVFSPVPLPALSRWRCAISIHSVMLSSMKPATSFPTCRPVSFSHTCKKSCKSKGANFANARIRFPTIRVAGTLSLSPLTASPSSVAALPLSFTTRSI